MHIRYRSALVVFALLAVATVTPLRPRHIRDLNPDLWQGILDGAAFKQELAKTDAAENWAEIQQNVARFGRYLIGTPARAATPEPAQQAADPARFAPGSTAPLTLADFAGSWGSHGFSVTINSDGSGDAGWRRGGAGVDIGRATLRAERVDGRTLYGTVLTTNYQDGLVRGPFELTEYDYGIGVLSDARVLGARAIGAPDDQFPFDTLCGPRYADAPEWFKRIRPCGA